MAEMRAYRAAEKQAPRPKYARYEEMQGPRHGMNRGPRMKDGREGRRVKAGSLRAGTGNATTASRKVRGYRPVCCSRASVVG